MDPYVYPESEVLRNRRGIRDSERLQRFETRSSGRRLTELQEKPLDGAFDTAHLQKIHRHIFQDVYRWAGEIRTVNIARSGQFPYAFPARIGSSLDRVLTPLRGERNLAAAGIDGFAGRAAHYLGEINAIHPFREGNGRAQREFIRTLAQRNGYVLDWSRTSQDQVPVSNEAVIDLLADLRHFCIARRIDFARCDRMAQSSFDAEISGGQR